MDHCKESMYMSMCVIKQHESNKKNNLVREKLRFKQHTGTQVMLIVLIVHTLEANVIVQN